MMGVGAPEGAAAGNSEMLSYANRVFDGEKADRILMYNPDAIVAHTKCTFSCIFIERDMAYFAYPTVQEIYAKVAELIIEDKYDFIAIHAANFDTRMHKKGPESIEALLELKVNTAAYDIFDALVQMH